MTSAAEWRESFPMIPWDEPLPILVWREDGSPLSVLACRFCIADLGLKAQDITQGTPDTAVWEKPDDFLEHLATVHGA